jgi:hypothetical protein
MLGKDQLAALATKLMLYEEAPAMIPLVLRGSMAVSATTQTGSRRVFHWLT